jgi:hypothetical protein
MIVTFITNLKKEAYSLHYQTGFKLNTHYQKGEVVTIVRKPLKS